MAQSISEELHELGLGHRPGRLEGRRIIFNIESGQDVAQLTAFRAIDLIRVVRAARLRAAAE